MADVQTRDRVYRALLSVLGLSDAHRAALAARGLTPDAIGQGGYASLPAPASRPAVLRRLRAALDGEIPADVPGIHPGKLLGAAGLLIPARDADGRIVALKVRADDPAAGKYLWLSSARQGGASPGAPCHVPVWTGPVGAVRVTEGPLKADVATRLSGRLTLGVPGVTAVRSAVPALRALGARSVVLAWDADAAHQRPRRAVARTRGRDHAGGRLRGGPGNMGTRSTKASTTRWPRARTSRRSRGSKWTTWSRRSWARWSR